MIRIFPGAVGEERLRLAELLHGDKAFMCEGRRAVRLFDSRQLIQRQLSWQVGALETHRVDDIVEAERLDVLTRLLLEVRSEQVDVRLDAGRSRAFHFTSCVP